jgi:hypothetical protein
MLTINLPMTRRHDVESVAVGGKGRYVLFPGEPAFAGQSVRFKFQGDVVAEGVVEGVGLDHATNTPCPVVTWVRHC